MEHYDIEGNKISHLIECRTCGNQVNVTEMMNMSANGLQQHRSLYIDELNPLIVCNHVSVCCEKPNYAFI